VLASTAPPRPRRSLLRELDVVGPGRREQAHQHLLHAAEGPLPQQLAAPGRQLRRRRLALARPPAEGVTTGEPQREALVVRPTRYRCVCPGGRWRGGGVGVGGGRRWSELISRS
jgi:hypothetical protein